ncbi:cupin domain-containing protein [[Clostridium] cellulosi]|nr:MAG: cupin domain-containing protein [[Clostridium] cellulosi]
MLMLKNIDFESVIPLEKTVAYQKGQIVSKTIAQNDAVSLTLFAFDKGEEISTHSSSGDAMVYILDGKAQITIDGKKYDVQKGETIVMPAGKPHALFATEQFKMFLIVVFPS